jgi:hypothetical protein
LKFKELHDTLEGQNEKIAHTEDIFSTNSLFCQKNASELEVFK